MNKLHDDNGSRGFVQSWCCFLAVNILRRNLAVVRGHQRNRTEICESIPREPANQGKFEKTDVCIEPLRIVGTHILHFSAP